MALVPMKPFAEAKQRLAGVLDRAARIELSREMFERTLQVLSHARGIERIAVVSRDEQVLKLARGYGARAIQEAQRGLNAALAQATVAACEAGANTALIVPADLPKIKPRDIEQIITLGKNPRCVVIAPAQRDEGTNALLVNPMGLIEYAFGLRSFSEHQRRARGAGARVEIYRAASVAFDVDLVEDWRQMSDRKLEEL